jgi:hypothetical protein
VVVVAAALAVRAAENRNRQSHFFSWVVRRRGLAIRTGPRLWPSQNAADDPISFEDGQPIRTHPRASARQAS